MNPEEARAYDIIITAILRSPRFAEAIAADRDSPARTPTPTPRCECSRPWPRGDFLTCVRKPPPRGTDASAAHAPLRPVASLPRWLARTSQRMSARPDAATALSTTAGHMKSRGSSPNK